MSSNCACVEEVLTDVVIDEVESTVVDEVEITEVVAVAEQGPPGPPGPPGPAGGATYTHTQAIPSAVWTVAHNLSRRPSVAVTDHLGNLLAADVLYVDADIVQVTHGAPYIGYAYCN